MRKYRRRKFPYLFALNINLTTGFYYCMNAIRRECIHGMSLLTIMENAATALSANVSPLNAEQCILWHRKCAFICRNQRDTKRRNT